MLHLLTYGIKSPLKILGAFKAMAFDIEKYVVVTTAM